MRLVKVEAISWCHSNPIRRSALRIGVLCFMCLICCGCKSSTPKYEYAVLELMITAGRTQRVDPNSRRYKIITNDTNTMTWRFASPQIETEELDLIGFCKKMGWSSVDESDIQIVNHLAGDGWRLITNSVSTDSVVGENGGGTTLFEAWHFERVKP